jgi:predicted transposase YbfD/YdcC
MNANLAGKPSPIDSFADHFGKVEDPRVAGRSKHTLLDLIVIAVLTMICGGEGWTDMEEFGRAREAWLRTFLELPSGIPTDDTFRRFFGKLSPAAFERAFSTWTQALAGALAGKLVAIDGKSVRGSADPATATPMLHLVHAWVAENKLLLAQVATQAKSNEIIAIPELLQLLDLKGAVVTIDAAGCQKNIAAQIVKQKADYVLSLRDNHPTFHQEVLRYFAHEKRGPTVFHHQTTDGEHGRIEVRSVFTTADIDWFEEKQLWPGLKTFVLIESERSSKTTGEIKHEARTYITSLDASDPARLAAMVRGHWGVENGLYWMLDVAFHEDQSLVRKDHAPRNLSLLRKLALMLVRREKTHKRGVATKRKRAAWDPDYLLKLLGAALDQ